MIPVSEKRTRKKPDYQKKVKLPSDMQSKHQRKCPICRAPMVNQCLRCGYIHSPAGNIYSEDFVKAGKTKGKYLVDVDI